MSNGMPKKHGKMSKERFLEQQAFDSGSQTCSVGLTGRLVLELSLQNIDMTVGLGEWQIGLVEDKMLGQFDS